MHISIYSVASSISLMIGAVLISTSFQNAAVPLPARIIYNRLKNSIYNSLNSSIYNRLNSISLACLLNILTIYTRSLYSLFILTLHTCSSYLLFILTLYTRSIPVNPACCSSSPSLQVLLRQTEQLNENA